MAATLSVAKANINSAPAKTDGWTVLQATIEGDHPHPGLVKQILAVKFDLENILHKALENSHIEVIQWFLCGTNITWNLKDPEEMNTPLHLAVARQHQEITKKLFNWDHVDHLASHDGFTLLHRAILNKDAVMVEIQVSSDKVDPNVVDCLGNIPLYEAIV